MPVDWSEFEAVEDSPVDWSEFEPVEENARGMGDLKVAEKRMDKRVTLESEMQQARVQSKASDLELNLLDAATRTVEPLTASGMLNQPSRAVGARDPFQPGTPVVDLPEPKGDSAMAGVGKLASRFAEGLTTPENLVTLAGAGGPSTGAALVRGMFGAEMAKHLPEQAAKVGETFGDTESTPSEKVLAAGEPALSAAMIGLLSKAGNAKTTLPKSAEAVGEKIKPEDVSDVQKGLDEIGPLSTPEKPVREILIDEETPIVEQGGEVTEFGPLKKILDEKKANETKAAEIPDQTQRPPDLLGPEAESTGARNDLGTPEQANRTTPVSESLRSAEETLASIINESIDQANKPTNLGISTFKSKRPADVVLGASDLKSVSPKVEARWQSAVKEKPSILGKLSESAKSAWKSMTREYADLNPREYAKEIDVLRKLRASRNANARTTVDVLRGITQDFGPKEYNVFTRVSLLGDLVKDVDNGLHTGKDLPFGYADKAELASDFLKFQDIANKNPRIKAALDRRNAFMDSLRTTLVDRGFLPESVLKDDRYFHHQVLFYMAGKNAPANAKSFRDWFSGWQKSRTGSSKDYNRQYVEAEAEVIADGLNKIRMQELQKEMKSYADLTESLKSDHGADWQKFIPADHVKWQPKKGNAFYPVHTVAEKAMDDYLNGIKDLMPEDFKEALAVGRKREEWVIKKDLAKVLDNLAPRADAWPERIAAAGVGGWKKWTLLNPLRAIKYSVNNMSGDFDFIFAANPKIFGEFKNASKDMYGFHKQKKAATGDIKEAMDLGVIGSGWRASELPNISNSQFFEWMTGEKPGLMNRYWDWIGSWNDAREDIGRLATYRYALKEWNNGKQFFGASKPNDVLALKSNKDKAAKVARELLIDYGRETEMGEFMRRKVMPFYRWMHGNFARYIQLVQNIPYQDAGGAGRVAGVVGKKLVTSTAGLTARMAFAYAAINIWNQTFFPEEEAELGEARNQLHLIVGRDPEGKVQTIRFQGALSDLLSWVGGENLPQDIEDVSKGDASLGDKGKDALHASVGKAVNATQPFFKTAAETFTGQSLYPDPFNPRPIRDKAEHVAGLFSLQNVYKWIAGKPHPPIGRELKNLLVYTTDPGEAAYNTTRQMAAEWLEKHGKERGGFLPTQRSNALYYYKQALRYKDQKLADKFLKEYYDAGGKKEGLRASILKSSPLSMLGKEKAEFMKSLSPEEKAIAQRADEWHKKVYRK